MEFLRSDPLRAPQAPGQPAAPADPDGPVAFANDQARRRADGLALAQLAGVKAGGTAPTAVPLRENHAALLRLRELPALRGMARRLAQTLQADYCLLDDIVAEVGRDPALALNVLRMANSAAIGAGARVEDLETALQLLGVVRVRLLAEVMAAVQESRMLSPGFDWSHLWLHSAACAALAERLNRWGSLRAGPMLHLAGLLHDVGKIALATVAPEPYRAALHEAWRDWGSLPPREKAWVGLDHQEAGSIFGRASELPGPVLSAITYHDAPASAPEEHRVLVAAVAVANRLAKTHCLGFSGDGDIGGAELGQSEAWLTLEAALGRELDARALEDTLENEWLEPLRGELRGLQRIGA
jgi:HD-like signal output (HDOD) protein